MNQLREGVEKKRQEYIRMLISAGIYKRADRQLYELTLSELQREYNKTFGPVRSR